MSVHVHVSAFRHTLFHFKTPFLQIFGEDLIGCLFMKHEWVVRETALRHLSREIIVFLTSASPVSSPLVEVDGSTPALTRVHDVLKISCQILEMMMQDPVYKVYVSSLVSCFIPSE